MRAPINVKERLNPVDHAYNRAVNQVQLVNVDTGQSETSVEKANTVKVKLRETDMHIGKSSIPESGTQDQPRLVYAGHTITYRISAGNDNSREAITNLWLEDRIPQGLKPRLDSIKIIEHRGQSTMMAVPLAGNTLGVTLLSSPEDPNHLVFEIDRLLPGQAFTFEVETEVLLPDDLECNGGIALDNQAKITRVFGQELTGPNIKYSDITHHQRVCTAVVLEGLKTLENRPILSTDVFEFVLKDEDGKELQVVKADTDGAFAFDKLSYFEPGTHTYTVSEVQGTQTGILYSQDIYKITVTVIFNETAGLFAEALYEKVAGENSRTPVPMVFNNVFEAAGSYQPKLKKLLEGRGIGVEEFSFTLYQDYGTDQQKALETVFVTADGDILFRELAFDQDDLDFSA